MNSRQTFIHPTAVIDEGAVIGEGVSIWHFCHLMTGCVIGDGCSLGQNVFVGKGVVLGKGVKVQNNVSLYEGVQCEDEVFVGPSAVFTNVVNPRAAVNRKAEYRQTIIRRGATVGANATVICGNEIGAYAFIGAGAVVTKSIPAYAMVVGNPARQKGWMSEDGEKLSFNMDGLAVCGRSGTHFRLQKGLVKRTETSSVQ